MGAPLNNNFPNDTTSDEDLYYADDDYSPAEDDGAYEAPEAPAARPVLRLVPPVATQAAGTGDDDASSKPPAPKRINLFGKVPDMNKIPEAATQDLTALGLASRLVIHYKDRVAFRANPMGGGLWYTYNGQCWIADSEGRAVDQLLNTIIISIRDDEPEYALEYSAAVMEAKEGLETAVLMNKEKMIKEARADLARAQRSVTWEIAKYASHAANNGTQVSRARLAAASLMAVPDHKFDTHKELINVRNGTLDLRTLKLREHRAEDYLTFIAAVAYVPGAASEDLDRNLALWRKSDDKGVDFVQRMFGSGLTGHSTHKKFLYIDGVKDAMKSTLVEALVMALGDPDSNGYGRVAQAVLFTAGPRQTGNEASPALHRLRGARLVFMDEAEGHGTLIGKELKKHSSGGTVNSRALQQAPVSWPSESTLVFAGNGRIPLHSDDPGVARRLSVLKLEHTVPKDEADPKAEGRMKADGPEREALFAWAVQGAYDWLNDGADDTALNITERMNAEAADYLASNDPLKDWWDEEIEVVDVDREDYVPLNTSRLHEYYRQFCVRHGLTAPSKTSRLALQSFGNKLTERGFPAEDTTRRVVAPSGAKAPVKGKTLRLGLKHISQDTGSYVSQHDF